jgi:2-C-methyl-D-erythritol 4-phosphate cytidylyltransferase/2-C-methyl-D-erythritol 2,4-cyclodiphosphate synthase
VVLVHDAARPLVSPALADAIAAAAAEHGAAVPTLPVVDSLKRERDGAVEGSVDRTLLTRAQTPQGARREILIDAFAATRGQSFTDEAALLESRGVRVATVPGEAANLKVTDPQDLELVRAIAAARHGAGADEVRFGLGEDSHGFGPADGLWLGGVLIDRAPRLHGHSDGDVVLHALSTALLSACGLGDLGRVFPDTDRDTVGIGSAVMLEEVVRRAAGAGWRLTRVQVSIAGARPRLGSRLDDMQTRIAELTGLPVESVALTASTGNLAGAEGAGRVIKATALVSVARP